MKFSTQGKSDKKQHYQISFGVPLWLYKPFAALQYQYRKWKYWANPDHCSCCGKRMFAKFYQIEHIFETGHRLLIENHSHFEKPNGKKVQTVCRDCLVKELEAGEWKPRFSYFHEQREGKPSKYNYRFWSQKQCAITGKKIRSFKDVEIYPYVDMTLCTNAWNHDYISKDAIIECAKKGTIKTSIWGIHKNKMVPMNHKRLFINDKGELL